MYNIEEGIIPNTLSNTQPKIACAASNKCQWR
jgi:hypothetical protein